MADASVQRMQTADRSSGGQLVAVDGRTLPLVGARLAVRAGGGIARTVLEQRFANPHPDPLRVTYLFPLPHDAAVSGFAFRIGARRIVGEVARRDEARERFEEAIASGRTAAILDQERGSVFTQELGNVPPGAEIVAELTLDQRLAWLPEGAWEWRFPTALAPRYQGSDGRVPDAERLRVDVAESPLAPRLTLALHVDDALGARVPECPSHAVALQVDARGLDVTFSDPRGVALDRDVVVRWPVATPEVGLALETFRAASGPLSHRAYGLLTLVPPSAPAPGAAFPRDLVVLLDTSGSMAGRPLDQARRVVSALVDGLGDEDTLELIAFSSAPRRWKRSPVRATEAERREALRWLAGLRGEGGTEMRDGISAALDGLRPDAQRQLLLVTDGHIGFEQEIVAELMERLPEATRLHTLGVGSSPNRSLLAPAARAGRGTESIVALDEDAERAARTLVARMEAPLVTDVRVSGSAMGYITPPSQAQATGLPDLHAASPALVSLQLRPSGGDLVVTGRIPGGTFECKLRVPAVEPQAGNPAIAALFGRDAIEDLEARIAAGRTPEGVGESDIVQLGLRHQIATRLTSWVAVEEEPSVDPTKPTRRVRMPQQLPYGMSVEMLGLRGRALDVVAGGIEPAGLMAGLDVPARGLEPRRALGRMPSAAPPTRPPRTRAPGELVGRIVLSREGELVVEVTLDRDFAWSAPRELGLFFTDGVFEMVRLDPARSTAAGKLPSGTILRLVLLRAGASDGRTILRIVGDGRLDIAMAPAAKPTPP